MIAFSAISVLAIEWLFGVQRVLSGDVGRAEGAKPKRAAAAT